MGVKSNDCYNCGGPIAYGGQTIAICGICGYENEQKSQELEIQEAKEEFGEMLGASLDDLESRLKASGDVETRDYIFKRDQLPLIDIHFENLTEKYEESFRRPIFQMNLLQKYNNLFDVRKVFQIDNKKNYADGFTYELNKFGKTQLNLPIVDLLAAKEGTKNHIQILKHHSMFLSTLFNIRGKGLRLDSNNLVFIEKLINLALANCQELIKLYANVNELNRVKFKAWENRLTLNQSITKILQACFNKQYSQLGEFFDKLITNIDTLIKDYRDKNKQDEDSYPLFFVMVIIEGFTIDKSIVQFLQKIVDIIIKGNIQIDFFSVLAQIESLFDIVDIPFTEVKLSSPEWDENWIGSIEEPFDRLFQILDNLALNFMIAKGETPIFTLDVNGEFFDAWKTNVTIEGKGLSKKHFLIKSSFEIKNKMELYIPIAVINTYAIMRSGVIRKAGEDFESILLVNPYFRLDPEVNNYGYAKAFGYIDIEESLKETDPLKTKLDTIDGIIESGSQTTAKSNFLALPILVTPKEIEEFVQKTYDLFSMVREGEEKIKKFKKLHKNVGIAKKLERLSGELIEYIYIPALLLNIAEGTSKKGTFVPKSNYEWRLLLPFNDDPKNPWNSFVRMSFNPTDNLLRLINQTIKFQSSDQQPIPQAQGSQQSQTTTVCQICGGTVAGKFCTKCGEPVQ